MKYTSQQYAVALYEALSDKPAEERQSALDTFFIILKKNRDLSLASKIIEAFEKYAREKEGVFSGELISAHLLSENAKSALTGKITRFMLETQGVAAKELYFNEKIDGSLIGGCRVKIGDMLMNMSIKGALEKMRKNLQGNIDL